MHNTIKIPEFGGGKEKEDETVAKRKMTLVGYQH